MSCSVKLLGPGRLKITHGEQQAIQHLSALFKIILAYAEGVVHGSYVKDHYWTPRWRLTIRRYGRNISDQGVESKDASLRIEIGNASLRGGI